jgi:hypothetical protein
MNEKRRESDFSTAARAGDVLIKWLKVLWPVFVVLVGWWANSVREPIQQIPELTRNMAQLQAQANRAHFNDSVSIEERRELRSGLMIVIRILCNNARAGRDVRCDDIPIPTGPAFRQTP